MKLPIPVRSLGRRKQDEKRVELKIMRPLRLREYVSGRGSGSDNVTCIQEMSVMMACFKANEFEQAPCAPEISKFQNCVTESRKAMLEREEMLKKGITVGAKKLNHFQVNKLLKKHPDS